MGPRVAAHAVAAAVVLVAATGAAALALVYGRGYAPEPIRSDGIGYYIYLPAVFLDHDPTLSRTVSRSFGGDGAAAGDLRRARHGWVGPHQLGEALLLAPFFGAGELGAAAAGESRDGFSRPYQAAAALGGLAYAVAGLALLGAFLRRWFDAPVVAAALLVLAFGTSLFHYATYDSVYSHAFSFAAVSFVLWSTARLAERPAAARAAAFGGGLGLVAAIRPTNLVLALFPALYGVRRPAGVAARARVLARRPGLGACLAAGFAVPVLLQVLDWRRVTGHLLVDPNGPGPRLEPLHPHLLQTAFSVRKGLFFWTPAVALAVAGLFALRGRARGLALAAGAALVVDFWVVASWSQWWYGGSFGQRALVDALPVAAIGLAALFDRARAGPLRAPVALAAVLCCALTLHAMVAYWRGDLPFDGTTWRVYVDSFT